MSQDLRLVEREERDDERIHRTVESDLMEGCEMGDRCDEAESQCEW